MSEESDDRYARARQRAKQLRGFYAHLTVYILVNIGVAITLFTINVVTSPGDWWFFWPLIGTGIGWGVALVIHGLSVFGGGVSVFSEDWEERKARQLLEREDAMQHRG